jgi:hypothetical protein
MEAAMSQIRQSSAGVDCEKIKSLVDSLSLEEAESAGVDAGKKQPLNAKTAPPVESSIEQLVAPAAIERALSIYQQLQQQHDRSVVVQARKILTQRIYAMVDQGESDQHRLTVGGLIHLKSVERDHAIKSATDSQIKK